MGPHYRGTLDSHEIDYPGFQVDAVQTVDFLDAGWTGYVHLGQVLANNVQADEIETVTLWERQSWSPGSGHYRCTGMFPASAW